MNQSRAATIDLDQPSQWAFHPEAVLTAPLANVNPVTVRLFVHDVVEASPARSPEKQGRWNEAALTVIRALPSFNERLTIQGELMKQAGELRRSNPTAAAVCGEIGRELMNREVDR